MCAINQKARSGAWVIVHGRVQGVFFRSSTRKKAHSLGISGYVKNLPDGTVEIVAEGSKSDIQQLISWAHDGPPAAEVQSVNVEWTEPSGDYAGFSVRY